MASKQPANSKPDEAVGAGPRDIWFECPACEKSLVVDEAGAGLIIECPQCHISIIVPPARPAAAVVAAPPHPPSKTAAPPEPAKPLAPPSVATLEVAALHERLDKLASQLRELQTQWTEVTNRIASRINEVNRELVVMARLDTTQKQILKEWNHIVSEIAASTQEPGLTAVPAAPSAGPSRSPATRVGAK